MSDNIEDYTTEELRHVVRYCMWERAMSIRHCPSWWRGLLNALSRGPLSWSIAVQAGQRELRRRGEKPEVDTY